VAEQFCDLLGLSVEIAALLERVVDLGFVLLQLVFGHEVEEGGFVQLRGERPPVLDQGHLLRYRVELYGLTPALYIRAPLPQVQVLLNHPTFGQSQQGVQQGQRLFYSCGSITIGGWSLFLEQKHGHILEFG